MRTSAFIAPFGAAVLLFASACGTHRGIYHTVQPGENVYRISLAYEISQEDILLWNGIDDPARLRVGDQLFVPGASELRTTTLAKRLPERRDPTTGWARSAKGNQERREVASLRQTPPAPPRRSDLRLRWPVKGTVTSAYGSRNGIHHDGLDIAAPEGVEVVAAADGRVLYAGDKLSGYGNLVIIRHAGNYSTVYAHNQKLFVKAGDFVTAGEPVAVVGQTGRASGPHLHFEVRQGKNAVDPHPFLP